MFTPYNTNFTGKINNIINTQDTASVGTLSNFGYLTVLIIIKETTVLKINVRYIL